jgi:predicted site-specific integrase-resolvase
MSTVDLFSIPTMTERAVADRFHVSIHTWRTWRERGHAPIGHHVDQYGRIHYAAEDVRDFERRLPVVHRSTTIRAPKGTPE